MFCVKRLKPQGHDAPLYRHYVIPSGLRSTRYFHPLGIRPKASFLLYPSSGSMIDSFSIFVIYIGYFAL